MIFQQKRKFVAVYDLCCVQSAEQIFNGAYLIAPQTGVHILTHQIML